MPKCKKCGRWGLFLKTNYRGICLDCYNMEEYLKKSESEACSRRFEQKRAEDLAFFREKIFPVVTQDWNIQETWSHWRSDIHNSDKQLDEQVKAIYEAIPILINTGKLSGIFISITTEFFESTLLSCTCPYFKSEGQPCMHMYRLFNELSKVERENPQIVEINKNILICFYSLSEKHRKDFINRIRYMDCDGEDRFLNEELSEEIEAGLLEKTDVRDYTKFLQRMTKDEIILALAKKGIQGYRPSWSKVKLIDWVIENQQDFLLQHFRNCAHISANEEILAWGKGINRSRDSWVITHPHFWYEVCKEFVK